MSQLLHLSKLDFANRVNEIAFQKNAQPNAIEKQYYISLLWKLIQQYMSKVEFNKTINDDFVIDGEQLNIHQNFLDWKFLCNYLFNMFDNYKLRFDFNMTTYQSRQAIRCVLYYESVIDEQTKSLSFILVADNTATHEDESNDDKNSNSGGSALERLKLDIKAMKDFAEKAPKIAKQGINILNSKDMNKFIKDNKNSFNFSKKDINEIEKFAKVTKSILKNNNADNKKELETIKANINNSFENKPFGDKNISNENNKSEKATIPDSVLKNDKENNKKDPVDHGKTNEGQTGVVKKINEGGLVQKVVGGNPMDKLGSDSEVKKYTNDEPHTRG